VLAINRYRIMSAAAIVGIGVMLVMMHALLNRARRAEHRPQVEIGPHVLRPDRAAEPSGEGGPEPVKIPVKAGTVLEGCLDLLNCYALQLDAVIIDMDLYLDRLLEEKQLVQEAAQRAVENLAELKQQVGAITAPEPCADLAALLVSAIDALQVLYADVASKGSEQIRKEQEEFWRLSSAFTGLYGLFERETLSGDDERLPEPEPQLQPVADLERYTRAMELMAQGKYDDARALLTELQERHADDPFVLLRKTDCIVRASLAPDRDIETVEDAEGAAIAILEGIVDGERYSPVLFEAFLKWRTLTQAHYHGVSNYSDIPNWQYNQKRLHVLKVIQKHLSENPDDVWAQYQKDALVFFPNIKRGGMAGNTNLTLWGLLYAEDLLRAAPPGQPGEAEGPAESGDEAQ